jgi:cytochrome oxidase assembly protein ShyY1
MLRFRPDLAMSILVAVLVPATIALGFWQLDRAAQKRAIEVARLASYGALPVGEEQLMQAPAFARVRLEGRFDGMHQFLLDNQTRRGVAGYVVVTPFDTVGGQRVLVSRGWIAAPSSRAELPAVAAPDSQQRIVGSRWAPHDTTTDETPWDESWPKRVEQFDGPRMGQAVRATQSIDFRLEEGQPGGLEPIIVGEEMSPVRHTGYAVQWFAMAAALSGAFVVFGFRRGRDR